MSYRVRIGCNDCTDQDDHGCFEGGTDWLYADTLTDEPQTFESFSDAVKAGEHEANKCSPWYYEVINTEDVTT